MKNDNFWQDETGASAIEYGLLIACISLICVVTFSPLRNAVKKPFDDAIRLTDATIQKENSTVDSEKQLGAPMPGAIVSIEVKPGDIVSRGDVLYIMEAMKMQTQIRADRDGVIAKVHAENRQLIQEKQTIIEFQ